MKTIKTVILALTLTLGLQAFAQQQLTCIYQVGSAQRGIKNVILTFNQDGWGRPTGGMIRIEHPYGEVKQVRIPGRDIVQMQAAPLYDAELAANVHVRSYNVDLVLNYSGNEFSNDVARWFRLRGWASERDLIEGYDQMSRAEVIRHRNSMPVAQFSGTVRGEDGELNKFASTQFVCSSSALNR